jgi:hypothetical protein
MDGSAKRRLLPPDADWISPALARGAFHLRVASFDHFVGGDEICREAT